MTDPWQFVLLILFIVVIFAAFGWGVPAIHFRMAERRRAREEDEAVRTQQEHRNKGRSQ